MPIPARRELRSTTDAVTNVLFSNSRSRNRARQHSPRQTPGLNSPTSIAVLVSNDRIVRSLFEDDYEDENDYENGFAKQEILGRPRRNAPAFRYALIRKP